MKGEDRDKATGGGESRTRGGILLFFGMNWRASESKGVEKGSRRLNDYQESQAQGKTGQNRTPMKTLPYVAERKIQHLEQGLVAHKYFPSTTTTATIFIRKKQASCNENGKKSEGMKEGGRRNRHQVPDYHDFLDKQTTMSPAGNVEGLYLQQSEGMGGVGTSNISGGQESSLEGSGRAKTHTSCLPR